jgi:hypothetical protein
MNSTKQPNRTAPAIVGYTMLAAGLLWIFTTTTIQRFKCPKMSETELLLSIPKNILLTFQICEP